MTARVRVPVDIIEFLDDRLLDLIESLMGILVRGEFYDLAGDVAFPSQLFDRFARYIWLDILESIR
jgi:hypothetical protein